jgi:hypothetical protein
VSDDSSQVEVGDDSIQVTVSENSGRESSADTIPRGVASSRPFTPLHTYYMAPNGHDSNNGTSPSTPWATPRHNVVCGDVIIAAAGSYSGGWQGGKWGTVSNCPSTTGGIDGAGGIYFAVLLCGGSDVMSCRQNGGNFEAFRIDQGHWAVEGWWGTQSTSGNGSCFSGENDTTLQQYIAFINNIASVCDLGGFSTSGGPCSGCGSFDHIAAVGIVSYNAANSISAFCGSGAGFIPGNPDSSTGTHIFISQYFGYYNTNAPGGCTVSGNPTYPHSDGEGLIFDTYGAGYTTSGFNKPVVAENMVIWHSGNSCIQAFPQGDGSTNDKAQYTIRNVTCYANGQDPLANCAMPGAAGGELFLNGIYPAIAGGGSYTVTNSIFLATMGACGNSPGNLPTAGQPANFMGALLTGSAAHVVTLTDPPINISGNYLWSSYLPTNTSDVQANVYVVNNSGGGPVFGAPWVFGTNTYNDPGLASPTSLPAATPNCTGYTNVSSCMNTKYSVYAHITPTIAPTTIGYQPPSVTCGSDALFPPWLKGIVYLHWTGSAVVQNFDLVTLPCGL